MQLFNKLMSTIFGRGSSQSSSSTAGGTGSSGQGAPAASGGSMPAAGAGGSAGGTAGGGSTQAAGVGNSTASAPSSTGSSVDVNAVLNEMASKNSEKLDWRKSIVDLMKLVGMDSSLSSRKQLADELGYSGDKNDSAKMNVWLHKQVLRKLSENGGKVPQDLLD
jgi:hypothetical protein